MAEKSNPGVQALIIGTVLGLAAAGYGGYNMSANSLTEPLLTVKSGKQDSSLTAAANAIIDNQKRNREVVDCAPEGATINGEPRLAHLFFSTELWQISLTEEKKNTIIDIYDPAAANIHGKIPNTWFISNGIADALGKSTGPTLDSDNDGFTNAEEFAANTHPNDAKSYPDLVSHNTTPKMVAVKIDKASALITADAMFSTAGAPTQVGIRIFPKMTDISPSHRATVKPGESFDLSDKDKDNRFTVVGFEKKEFPGFTGRMTAENVVRIRDNVTANEMEREFLLRAGKPSPTSKENNTPHAKGKQINDTTITLRVTGGPAAGKPEGTIRVPLHGKFDIPGGNSQGKKVTATLVSVDKAGSVNIKIDGQESEINIPKRGKN